MNWKKKLAVMSVILGVFALSGTAVLAALYNTVDLEGASIQTNWDLIDSGVTYQEKNLDHNQVVKPFLSTWTPSGTGHSLKFQHNPYTSSLVQRTEYYIAQNQSFNNWRYVGYDFLIPAGTTLPVNWVIITQFQQEGFYTNPIGDIELQNKNGNFNIGFSIRSEDYNQIDGVNGPGGYKLLVWDRSFSLNAWNKIVVGFKPNPAGNGEVKIWFNGQLQKEWTGKIGYPANYKNKPFTQTYQNTFGIYRGAQNNSLTIYFDNYKYGSTYNDVAN
jgi:hypothetical protein